MTIGAAAGTGKIAAAAAIAAVACVSTLAMALAPASAAPGSPTAKRLSVSGEVTCAGSGPVDGVWVTSSGGGSTYAKWRPTSISSASYKAWLITSIPTAISLHVGCGGSPVDWESAGWTPSVLMVTGPQTISADCSGNQCVFPHADRAAAWAQSHLTVAGGGNRALAADKVSDKRAYASWAGLDLAFAVSAYLNAAGLLPRPSLAGSVAAANSSASAIAMYKLYSGDRLLQRISATGSGVTLDPPRGALVFYMSSASSGHIAISTGTGRVISANSAGSPLVREQGYQSIPGYQGWAFPANMVGGQSGSLSKPAVIPPAAIPTPSGHGANGAAHHPARSAAAPRPSRQGQAAAGRGWLYGALLGGVVLLAVSAIAYAIRPRLRTRSRNGRHRQEGAVAPQAAAGKHNRSRERPADTVGQAARTVVAASSEPTAAPPPSTSPPGPVPPAPRVPVCDLPASPPSMPPPLLPSATSGYGGGPVVEGGSDADGGFGLAAVGTSDLGEPAGLGALGATATERRDGAGADERRGWPRTVRPPALSTEGLRMLGLRATPAKDGETAVTQRHEVVLGDYRVEAVLAEAPAHRYKNRSKSHKRRAWVTSAPYLVWTPLPHDVPREGTAFACIGAGKGGCLFIDLAAAPGPLTLGGEPKAASRLAESLAHQLCTGPAADRVHLVVAADAVPAPVPPGAEHVPSAAGLGARARPGTGWDTELVFCRLKSDEEVISLARYVASAPYRVIPVILADLPGAPWSLTAHPSKDRVAALQSVVS